MLDCESNPSWGLRLLPSSLGHDGWLLSLVLLMFLGDMRLGLVPNSAWSKKKSLSMHATFLDWPVLKEYWQQWRIPEAATFGPLNGFSNFYLATKFSLPIFRSACLEGIETNGRASLPIFPQIEQMSIKCDRSHTHAPWGSAHDSDGKQVWATSLESAYPHIMCVALVNVVLQCAQKSGLQLKSTSLNDDVNPLLSAQNAQIHAGRQPRPSKVPPMVADFFCCRSFCRTFHGSNPLRTDVKTSKGH